MMATATAAAMATSHPTRQFTIGVHPPKVRSNHPPKHVTMLQLLEDRHDHQIDDSQW